MSDEFRAAHADAVRQIQVLLGRVLTFVASLDTNLESKLKDEAGSFDNQMADWLQQLTRIREALSERKKLINQGEQQQQQPEENSNKQTNEKKLVLETIYSLQSLFLRAENSNEPNEIKKAIKSVESFVSSGSDLFKFKENTGNERRENLLDAISSFERLINHAPDAAVVDKLKGIYSQMTLILLNIIRSVDVNPPICEETVEKEIEINEIKNDSGISEEEEEISTYVPEHIKCVTEQTENIIQDIEEQEEEISEYIREDIKCVTDQTEETIQEEEISEYVREDIKCVTDQTEEIIQDIEEQAVENEKIVKQFVSKESKKEIKFNDEIDARESEDVKISESDKKGKKKKDGKKDSKEEKEKHLDWYEELLKEEQEVDKRTGSKAKSKVAKEYEKRNKFSSLKVLRTHVPGAVLEPWALSEAAAARGSHAYTCKLPGTELEARAVANNKRTARAEAAALLLDKIVTLQKISNLPEDVTPLTDDEIHLLNTLEAHNWPNRLQKFCGKLHKPRPIYTIMETKPKFVIKCEACDLSGIGINAKKTAAKKEAAKSLLEQLEEWNY